MHGHSHLAVVQLWKLRGPAKPKSCECRGRCQNRNRRYFQTDLGVAISCYIRAYEEFEEEFEVDDK
jgi:hypothetical protein